MLALYVTASNNIQYSIIKIDYTTDHTKISIQNQENGYISNLEFNEILTVDEIVTELMTNYNG